VIAGVLFFGAAHATSLTDAAEKAVREKLREPNSARFIEVREIPPAAGPASVVCGKVSAKNGQGGYSGAVYFVFIGPPMNEAYFRDEAAEGILLEPDRAGRVLWVHCSGRY